MPRRGPFRGHAVLRRRGPLTLPRPMARDVTMHAWRAARLSHHNRAMIMGWYTQGDDYAAAGELERLRSLVSKYPIRYIRTALDVLEGHLRETVVAAQERLRAIHRDAP